MRIRTLHVGELGTNCYLVQEEGDTVCTVVDPGGEPDRVARAAESMGYVPGAILLTHGHYDHTGGVAGLQAQFPGIPVYLSEKDRNPAYRAICPPVEGTTDVHEGDQITVGSLTFTVMETPGHSAGSVVYRCGDVLLCGDTLFAGSCGRTDFPGGSQEEILKSLARLGALEGNLTVCPGHMETSTLDRERESNPYMRWALKQ